MTNNDYSLIPANCGCSIDLNNEVTITLTCVVQGLTVYRVRAPGRSVHRLQYSAQSIGQERNMYEHLAQILATSHHQRKFSFNI